MAARPTEGRHGLTALRLSELPDVVRHAYGDRLVKLATLDADLLETVALTRAIDSPSDRVYWVPTAAYDAVRGQRRWRKRWTT